MLTENEKKIFDSIRKYKLSNEKNDLKNSIDIIVSILVYEFSLKPNLNENNPLSIIEILCLILLVVGKSSKECAALMGISPKSIKTYELRMRRKLSAKNRANALYVAQVKGYISLII